MKHFYFLIFLTVLLSSCEKDYSVSGVVTEKCGERPVKNITVRLTGCNDSTYSKKQAVTVEATTDENGEFILQFSKKEKNLCDYMGLNINVYPENNNYTGLIKGIVSEGSSHHLIIERIKRRLDIKIMLSPNYSVKYVHLSNKYKNLFEYDSGKGTYYLYDGIKNGFRYAYLTSNPVLFEVTLINNNTNDSIVKTDTAYFDCALDTLTIYKTY